jgi:hypothetical protein
MGRVETLTYKGKSIVLVDLSNCKPEDTIKILAQGQPVIARCAPKSALIMTDVTGAVYNKEVADAMKKFSSNNTPFVKASAVVGAEGVQMILLQTVSMVTRREIKVFKTREQAQDWLSSHA